MEINKKEQKMKRFIIIIFAIISLIFSINLYSKEESSEEEQISESEKIKIQIQDLLKTIKSKNEQARNLFMEAKIKADSLYMEAEQKLTYLDETIEKAKKSKAVDKKELNKAIQLQKEAKKLFSEHEYIQVIELVNKALGHISKVPVVSINVTPQLFSPDGDGQNDTLTITSDIFSINKITSWTLMITKKEEGDKVAVEIKTWSGVGSEIPKNIKWNGKSDGKIAVDSAGSYIVQLIAVDEKKGVGKSSQVRFKTDIFTTRTKRGLLINISSIRFRYNKADLLNKYKPIVKRVYDFLLEYPEYQIIVEGHTDASGKAVKNKTLSEARAKSVANFLIESGMDKRRIKESGLGEALPFTYKKRRMALNRRVSFILLKTKEDTEIYENYISKLNLNKEVKMKK